MTKKYVGECLITKKMEFTSINEIGNIFITVQQTKPKFSSEVLYSRNVWKHGEFISLHTIPISKGGVKKKINFDWVNNQCTVSSQFSYVYSLVILFYTEK